jgi:uncharacterized protein YjgD (DUF1641 family)
LRRASAAKRSLRTNVSVVFLASSLADQEDTMAVQKDMVARLNEEGILDATNLSDQHKEMINKLTDEEIQALISIRQKLSFFSWPIKPMMF